MTHVGVVYTETGLGDKSFNDSAHKGMKQAAEDFNLDFDNSEPEDPSEMKPLQRRYAQSSNPDYDLVICIAYNQAEPLSENSTSFPDQKFMIVDGVVEEPNVASYTFKEHEGSFQVGHLAGLMTQRDFSAGGGETRTDSNKVGFLGGRQIPLIEKFEAGFRAGVRYAGAESISSYTGSFTDISKGNEVALNQYDNGADIVYHAAGPVGEGLFTAAEERGRYAIGVDSDQSITAPEYADYIMASMIKRVDTAVYTASEDIVNDNFNGGEHMELDVAKEGVGCTYGQSLESKIPDEVKSEVESSRQEIANGEITIPKSRDELEGWEA